MSSRQTTGLTLFRRLSGDRPTQLVFAVWVLLALQYFLVQRTGRALTVYSEFWVDLLLLPPAVFAICTGLRSRPAPGERFFWQLLAASLGVFWLVNFSLWTPRGTMALYVAADLLYLVFYLLLILAALSAPYRGDRPTRKLNWSVVLGVSLWLLGLLTYFVIIPSTLNADRYTTWLPSMYLFLVLDVVLLGLFLQLFARSAPGRWRSVYGLLALAIGTWTVLDALECAGWAGVLNLPPSGPFDLAWTLPTLIVVVAARRPFDQGEREEVVEEERRADASPAVSHIALLGTVAFPLIHFGFRSSGLLDPTLDRSREVLVLASVLALGAAAFLERRRTLRRRGLERRRREKVEAELRESEARYRTLVENAPEAIVVLDVDTGRFVDSNVRALELFELTPEQLLELGPAELSPPRQPDGRDSVEAAREMIGQALDGEAHSFEWVHLTSSGKEFHCQVHLVAVPAEGRRLVRGSLVDITDQLILHDQLRESRRMESIGRLAGGVAHDFNNLLTVVTGNSEIALASPEIDEATADHLREIHKAGEKAATLTRQLLAFGRRQEMRLEALDLNRVVEDMEALLRRLIGEDVSLELALTPELAPVKADRVQVEQVIVNLAANGRDAMPDGGVLRIETGRVELTKPVHQADMIVPAGVYGRLAVHDQGVGMDEATRRRAFEPFFTTKSHGEGTGLGLATVYGIVTQSRGYLTVDSDRDRGSVFAAHFPLTEPSAVSVAGAAGDDATDSPEGDECLLLVEDEESVRNLLTRGLEELGYTVWAAADGDQALEVMEGNGDRIEVLVTDVVLPGLSGPELADLIFARKPEVKIIFISGYTDDLIRRKGGIATDAPLLPKPFSPLDLARTVRRVLAAE